MGSKTSRSDASSDLTTIAHHHQSKNKVLLLGPSDTGKSALFFALKRLIPNNGSAYTHYPRNDPEEEMQLACSWVIEKIYLLSIHILANCEKRTSPNEIGDLRYSPDGFGDLRYSPNEIGDLRFTIISN